MRTLLPFFRKSKTFQYTICISVTILVSLFCYSISDFTGYRTIALILLFSVSLLASVFSVYPVLLSAVLSALIWDYFFIPPSFTFHVDSTEDLLMLSMYFVVALLNGILTSKLRQIEKQAREKEEKLNALNLYSTLFNSISHELRTPITTIMGSAEHLIQNRESLSEKGKEELCRGIGVASKRLNRLVDNLLNIQRLESGLLKPRIDWCDINDLVSSAVKRLTEDIELPPGNIQIHNQVSVVNLDYGLIEQALYNILHNAVVHTDKEVRISVESVYSKGQLILSVTDNGRGFQNNPELHVFEKFYRSPVAGAGGLGLGLSIAKGFAEAHHGRIAIQNNRSGGATVTLIIPCKKAEIESENE